MTPDLPPLNVGRVAEETEPVKAEVVSDPSEGPPREGQAPSKAPSEAAVKLAKDYLDTLDKASQWCAANGGFGIPRGIMDVFIKPSAERIAQLAIDRIAADSPETASVLIDGCVAAAPGLILGIHAYDLQQRKARTQGAGATASNHKPTNGVSAQPQPHQPVPSQAIVPHSGRWRLGGTLPE